MFVRPAELSLALCALLSSIPAVHAAGTSDFPPRVDGSFPNSQPPYPLGAQDLGEQGTVVVDVYVKPSGKPEKAKISQSSGFADLDQAAMQGVLNWRFIPAMRDSDKVSEWTTVKVVYQVPVLAPPPAAPH